MTINFGLNFLTDYKFSDFIFNLFNAKIESFCNFSHVNYFIGGYVLDESLLSYSTDHMLNFVPEKYIEFQLGSDGSQRYLEFCVLPIKKVFNNITSFGSNLRQTLKIRATQYLILHLFPIHRI